MDQLTEFTAEIAREIDRVFIGAMQAARAHGGLELGRSYGGPEAVGVLIDLRTRLGEEGGKVTNEQFVPFRRYWDPAQTHQALLRQAELGMITYEDGTIEATGRGRELITAVYTLHARITRSWPEHLAPWAHRVLQAARISPPETADGHALAAVAPPFEPPGTPTGVLLLNRLSCLRYARADAHASAWQSAGATAAEMSSESVDHATRTRIEERTNETAAGPWTALSDAERDEFLKGLQDLRQE
ncbi:hypothetical protein [Hamadaea tsunoensis]|uniref:hypothetical protein n=1 Tax=Hamadaea tsunoensis TaxID=53368 RepID=UPI0003FEFBDF|nr:hypothetical protein [Hamadaea tsunoensis]